MNPFLLLLLGLGGFMAASGGGSLGTTSQAATVSKPGGKPEPDPGPGADPETPPAGGEDGGDDAPAAAIGITLVVYEDRNGSVIREIADGESIDFGSADVSGYSIGAEIDGTGFDSVVFEVGGQTVIQSFYPYNMPTSSLDLTDGSYDVRVTVHSGDNGGGQALATRTISFDTAAAAAPTDDNDPVEETPVVDDASVEEPPVVVDTPTEEEPPADDEPPVVVDNSPSPPPQTDGGTAGGGTEPIVADGTVQVTAGRVATLSPADDDTVGVRIVSGLSHGKVTVNPDNTFAVVLTLSDRTSDQSFTYEATHSDGSVSTHRVNLDVTPGVQEAGWATGASHYMLETDENGDIVVETGEDHTKVYISGSNNALTLADIAAREGMSVNQVTGDWLAAHGGYGQSEGFALAEDAGMALWRAVTPRGSTTSNHLLFERGHSYDDLGQILERGTYGESELHPIYIGAWGEGEKPVIATQFAQAGEGTTNLVVQGIEFTGGVKFQIDGENLIFDDLSLSLSSPGMVIMDQDGVTIRNSDFTDIYTEEPNGSQWDAMADRTNTLYASGINGLRLEGNFFDYNGWREGYDPNGSGDLQPAGMHSHNMYIQADNSDVTLRDTISMRASSWGANFRSGGFLEDNVLIDNNAGFNNLGGDYRGAGPVGNYSLINGNLVTSGAYKDAERIGAKAWGFRDNGEMSTLIDNIVAHLADPNNPAELEYKEQTELSYSTDSAYYDDTIVWNWEGAEPSRSIITEQNVDGLNQTVLDQTTIQIFTAQLLGRETATIKDLAAYLRAQADGAFDDVVDADLILAFFREGFGLNVDIRTEAETARFIPDDLGDGVRWDNRLNWSTEDLPGSVRGDSVDLGGNTVIFNGNAAIDKMEFGPSGRLELYGGRLTAAGEMTTSEPGAEVFLSDAGQLWASGHEGEGLDIDIVGGRFVNTGAMRNSSLEISDGQAILATGGAIYGISADETLSVLGDAAVGFDDDDGGIGLLVLEQGSTLSLGVQDGRLGSIEEFRSGAFGDSPDIRSGIDLGNGVLEINLAGLSAAEGMDLTLLDADEIIGALDDANVSGLGGRDASVIVDYVNDSVSLQLSSGSGRVLFQTVGQETDVGAGEQALWDALTEGQGVFDESPPDLPEEDEEFLEAV